jgi:hypothetical protein
MQSPSTASVDSPVDSIEFLLVDAPSTLNPNAPAFVPAWQVTDPDEARRVDDICRTLHHFATVNDTETLLEAEHWLGTDPSEWVANGAEYSQYHGADFYDDALAYEDQLRGQLHTKPRQPKGSTVGRARSKGKR